MSEATFGNNFKVFEREQVPDNSDPAQLAISSEIKEAYEERQKRIEDAIACTEPDRVPFMSQVANFFNMGYGVNTYDAMLDMRNIRQGVVDFFTTYYPDISWSPDYLPYELMEVSQPKFMNWPGPGRLPLDAPFQSLDGTYLEDDEYPEFINNAAGFILNKVLPRKYHTMESLEFFDILSLGNAYPAFIASSFMAPGIGDAFKTMMKTAEVMQDFGQKGAEIKMLPKMLGFPTYDDARILTPFDEFADAIRGLINAVTDIHERPDELMQALDIWAANSIAANMRMVTMFNAKRVLIPLHAGVDEFMSPENYKKFYWKYVKMMIDELLAIGVTPFLCCEGNYFTRLEQLTDVPAGKVVYIFEKTDFKRAKEVLGKTACVCGGMPSATLINGSKKDIVEETKRVLDIAAPGGSYMMTSSMSMDNIPHESLAAWREAVWEFGVY